MWVRGTEVGTKTCRNRAGEKLLPAPQAEVWLQAAGCSERGHSPDTLAALLSRLPLCPPLPALLPLWFRIVGHQAQGHSCTLCCPERLLGMPGACGCFARQASWPLTLDLPGDLGLDPATEGQLPHSWAGFLFFQGD